ncbi:MAG: radical SAM protein [Armatimonadetes bacterium]|nr:radical SAM protein [Armatimonadota bacterium]
MKYQEYVIRPPSEARSFILQVTLGCSHNQCAFCGTYRDIPFQVKSLKEIHKDILMAKNYYGDLRRVFLADGNALILPTERLLKIIDYLKEVFPSLQRVGIYSRASDILLKTSEELKALKSAGMNIFYVGLESGSDKVLSIMEKGYTHAQAVKGCLKAQESGIKLSTIILLGIGGKDLAFEHALESAQMLNTINPRYLSVLTLTILKNTPLYIKQKMGIFQLPKPKELLEEMKIFLENLNLSGCIFRTNHASNYLSLEGILNKDQERILQELKQALKVGFLRPEFLRSL